MLLIDDRAGSKELKPHLDRLGVPNDLTRLEFGDVMFLGRGPNDDWLKIGIEYKSLPDVLSCITTGRFAGHQLPGMLRRDVASREYDVTWLLVQGVWRVDSHSGVVQVPRRMTGGGTAWVPVQVGPNAYMGRQLDGFLFTITQQSGIRIAKVGSEQEAAYWLGALYHWWTDKSWDDHKSLQTFDLSGPMVQIEAPKFTRRVAKELPGVGWKKSESVVEHFGCVQAMSEADEKEWAKVPGIGKVLATRIVAALHGAGTGDDA